MIFLPRFAYSSYWAVKRQVDRFDKWPAWQQMRRGLQAPIYRFADTGLFGLKPLQMHILICGFPASGTTLLQLMIENGLPDARRFGRERSGWKAATYTRRNHSLMISKQPRDLLRLEPLREFYSTRSAKLKIILMLRDPRDLMTSQRKKDDHVEYCGDVSNWKEYYLPFLQQRDRDDTLVVRFEDLIADPDLEQKRVEEFTAVQMKVPFRNFLSVQRSDFDTTTLCGLRPLDNSRVGRWREAEHQQRISQVLRDLPELPTALERLGYETNSDWTAAYSVQSTSNFADSLS